MSFIFKVGITTEKQMREHFKTGKFKVHLLQVQPESDRLYRYAQPPLSSTWWDPDHVPGIEHKQRRKISLRMRLQMHSKRQITKKRFTHIL